MMTRPRLRGLPLCQVVTAVTLAFLGFVASLEDFDAAVSDNSSVVIEETAAHPGPGLVGVPVPADFPEAEASFCPSECACQGGSTNAKVYCDQRGLTGVPQDGLGAFTMEL